MLGNNLCLFGNRLKVGIKFLDSRKACCKIDLCLILNCHIKYFKLSYQEDKYVTNLQQAYKI